MRRLVYLVAVTADGFIARTDGSFDGFLTDGEHIEDLFRRFPETFSAHFRQQPVDLGRTEFGFDTVLMGRRTYEVAAKAGILSPYPHLRQIVFSRSIDGARYEPVQVVAGDAVQFVQRLKQDPGGSIWLCGGSELAGTLLDEIDELVLKVNPVVLGDGLSPFHKAVPAKQMELLSSHMYNNGVALMHYRLPTGR